VERLVRQVKAPFCGAYITGWCRSGFRPRPDNGLPYIIPKKRGLPAKQGFQGSVGRLHTSSRCGDDATTPELFLCRRKRFGSYTTLPRRVMDCRRFRIGKTRTLYAPGFPRPATVSFMLELAKRLSLREIRLRTPQGFNGESLLPNAAKCPIQ